jgi:hypothetical protein
MIGDNSAIARHQESATFKSGLACCVVHDDQDDGVDAGPSRKTEFGPVVHPSAMQGGQVKARNGISGFPYALERRRPGYPCPDCSEIRVRKAEIIHRAKSVTPV